MAAGGESVKTVRIQREEDGGTATHHVVDAQSPVGMILSQGSSKEIAVKHVSGRVVTYRLAA